MHRIDGVVRPTLLSFIAIIVLLAPHQCLSASIRDDPESWKSNWFAEAQKTLKETVEAVDNKNVARNVILFLGDGMGVSTVTAGRIYLGQRSLKSTGEEASLSFDKFPHVALVKTYNVDYQVPDSAGTATAYLCGVKANQGTLGVDQNVRRRNCGDMTEGRKVPSIIRWSIAEGKRTGIVTTSSITDATPAAGYAHSPERKWEADSQVTGEDKGRCHDIAKQLVVNNSDINVLLGGGRKQFLPNDVSDPEYGSQFLGTRTDGVDLTQLWLEKTKKLSSSSAYVWNKEQFDRVKVNSTDYLLGLFEPNTMKYSLARNKEPNPDEPSLAEMTEKAIGILRRGPKGYFLLIEGGRIDHAHHANQAKTALEDLVALNEAVDTAVRLTDRKDTLIVVTADHSHVLTISGYPARGNPILGLVADGAGKPVEYNGLPYTTLSYANGPSKNNGQTNLRSADLESDDFTQPATFPLPSETHSGDDVGVYALGPMSHLFHGVVEQHYIAHAMAYASCVGINKKHCINDPAAASVSGADGWGARRWALYAATVIAVYLAVSRIKILRNYFL